MIKLNADVHPSLSETVVENLRRRNVITIVDFVSTDPIKLASFTDLTHTVRILRKKNDTWSKGIKNMNLSSRKITALSFKH